MGFAWISRPSGLGAHLLPFAQHPEKWKQPELGRESAEWPPAKHILCPLESTLRCWAETHREKVPVQPDQYLCSR